MFEKNNANTLPKHRPYNCNIDLEEKTQPPFEPIYNLSQDELIALREYINEIFKKRFIQHSKFLTSAFILFIKKTYGSLRMCVNYNGLDRLTIKKSVPFAPSFKVVGPAKSCQGVHQDWFTWNIQFGVHSKR